jgi:hypothetical protein
MRAFDSGIDPAPRARVEPVQRLFDLRDRDRVLSALELRRLVVLDPLQHGIEHRLDKRPVRLLAVRRVGRAEWAVLLVDLHAGAAREPARRPALLV